MKKKTSLPELLIGDTLGALVKRLANERGQDCTGDERIIVIMLHEDGVTLASSGGVNRLESAGALQVAYDMVISYKDWQ